METLEIWKKVSGLLTNVQIVCHWRPKPDLVNVLLPSGGLLQLGTTEDGRQLSSAHLEDLTDARTFELVSRYHGISDLAVQPLPHSASLQLSGLPCSLAVLAGGPFVDTGSHFMWLRTKDYISRWEHPLATMAHIEALKQRRAAATAQVSGAVRLLQPLPPQEHDEVHQEHFNPCKHDKYTCVHYLQLPAAVQRVQVSARGQLVLFRGARDSEHGAAVFAADVPRQHVQHNAVDLSLGASREHAPPSLLGRLRGGTGGVRDPSSQLLPSDALAGLSAEPLMVLPGDGSMVLHGSCSLAGPPSLVAAQPHKTETAPAPTPLAPTAGAARTIQQRLLSAECTLQQAAGAQLSALQAVAAAAATVNGADSTAVCTPGTALRQMGAGLTHLNSAPMSGTVINFTLRFKVCVRGFRAPNNSSQLEDDAAMADQASHAPTGSADVPLSQTASARIQQLQDASSEEWSVFRHTRMVFLEGEASATRALRGQSTSTWAIPLGEALDAAGLPRALASPNAWLEGTEHWVAASAFDPVASAACSDLSACRLHSLRLGIPHDAARASAPSSPPPSLRLRVLSCEGTSVFGRTAVEGHATMVPALQLHHLPAPTQAPQAASTAAVAGATPPPQPPPAGRRVLSCEVSVAGLGGGAREALVHLLRQPLPNASLDATPGKCAVAHTAELTWLLESDRGDRLAASNSQLLSIRGVEAPLPVALSGARVAFDVTVRIGSAQGVVAGGGSELQALRLRFSNDRAATAFVNAARVQYVVQEPVPSVPTPDSLASTGGMLALPADDWGDEGATPLPPAGDKSLLVGLPVSQRVWCALQAPAGGVACSVSGFAAVRKGEMEGGEAYAPRALHPQRQEVFRGALGGTTGSTVREANPAAASTKLAVRHSWLVR